MRRRKAGPALLWRDDRLSSVLVEELLDTLNDPHTAEGSEHWVLRFADRLARGKRPFRATRIEVLKRRAPRAPHAGELARERGGFALVVEDGEIASWQAPTIRITADEHGRLRWELEPDPRPEAHERTRRLVTALALVSEDDALRRRFRRCPACAKYFLAKRAGTRYCSDRCRWNAAKR